MNSCWHKAMLILQGISIVYIELISNVLVVGDGTVIDSKGKLKRAHKTINHVRSRNHIICALVLFNSVML